MARVKGTVRTERTLKTLKLIKGYFGGKSKLYRTTNQPLKSQVYACDRRQRKEILEGFDYKD